MVNSTVSLMFINGLQRRCIRGSIRHHALAANHWLTGRSTCISHWQARPFQLNSTYHFWHTNLVFPSLTILLPLHKNLAPYDRTLGRLHTVLRIQPVSPKVRKILWASKPMVPYHATENKQPSQSERPETWSMTLLMTQCWLCFQTMQDSSKKKVWSLF